MNPPPILHAETFLRYPEVLLAVSTRRGGVSPDPYGMNLSFRVGDAEENVRLNRALFFDTLKISEAELAIPQQVHSGVVKVAYAPGRYEHCDALVTVRRRVFLSVSVADCVPIFLFEPKKKVVAAVHAGWRGTQARIAATTIEVMHREFGCDPTEMIAFIGPSARSCCYEVGKDVATQFEPRFIAEDRGRLLLDLLACNVSQLLERGVPGSSIEASPHCTICTPDVYHSYRRDGQRSGRMLGVLGLL